MIAFDGTPADTAVRAVGSVSFIENDSRAKLMAPDRLALPGVLSTLGITHARDGVTLTTLGTDGKTTVSTLRAIFRPGFEFRSGLPEALPSWLKHRDKYRWYEIRPEDDAIYVQVNQFEELTYAAFVGEPSGAKPSHYGDSRRVVLDNSGITVRVSTIYWHSWLANDFRDAVHPHIPATLMAADYFAGRDPVLAAAIDYELPGGLAQQIDEQFRQGTNQNALLLFTRFMSDGTLADHEYVVPELRSMADRLAEDGYARPGFFVYFLVNRTFPGDPVTEAGLKRLQAQQE